MTRSKSEWTSVWMASMSAGVRLVRAVEELADALVAVGVGPVVGDGVGVVVGGDAGVGGGEDAGGGVERRQGSSS